MSNQIPEEIESLVSAISQDIAGNIAFNSYVNLGAKFVTTATKEGEIITSYDREKHQKCFAVMEADFEQAGSDNLESPEGESVEEVATSESLPFPELESSDLADENDVG